MATPVKVGARNDLYALKEARRLRASAANTVEAAMNELKNMREVVGRPDFGRIDGMLGRIALDLSKVSYHHEEMWTIRELAGQASGSDLEELRERLIALEAEMAEMRALMTETLQ